MEKCRKHDYVARVHSTHNIEFGCKECGKELLVALTKEESEESFNLSYKSTFRSGEHKCWWDFEKKFVVDNKGKLSYIPSGYKLMKEVEKWAKNWPKDVQIVGCDDSLFSGSSLVLIQHQCGYSYMGCTVVVIPQLAGPPCQFFLYPSHARALVEALGIVIEQSSVKRRPDPLDKKFDLFFNKVLNRKLRRKGPL